MGMSLCNLSHVERDRLVRRLRALGFTAEEIVAKFGSFPRVCPGCGEEHRRPPTGNRKPPRYCSRECGIRFRSRARFVRKVTVYA